ncbi:MAG TPA: hypothetical protein ENJ09_07160 [Planctomycetes bacterium]|nr:hypothetical protein [Planctomycetota bacterium]
MYTGTPTDCYSCHASAYQSTTNPDHQAAGYPTTCENCHSTISWQGATFNHNTWPLTGAHMGLDCSECHVGGVYKGTPTDCFSCHASAYQSTTNPDHQAAGFPTTCEICHTTTMWQGATFNHPQFPITSGKHKNLDCADCHTTPGNYMAFSCIDCHEHRQSKMDDEHKGVSGYVWQSSACYACHPDGKE